MPSRKIFGRSFSLSTYLVMIVIIATVPMMLLSGVVMNRLLKNTYDSSKRLLVKTADEMVMGVDHEIRTTIRTLEALSVVASLKRHNLKSFRNVIAQVNKTQNTWATIFLHDSKGKWLLNAEQPYGTKFGPPLEPESLLKTIATGRPTIGKIIRIPKDMLPSSYGFAVRVPVKDQDNKVIYVLSAIITSDGLNNLMNRYGTAPNEWVRSLVDANGIVAARSRNPDKYIGGPATDTMLHFLNEKGQGLEAMKTLDGISAYTAFSTASFSGWHSAIAVPAEVLEAKTTDAKRTIVIMALAMFVLSTLVTLYFARWLRKTIKAGSDSAAVLAQGQVPKMEPSAITEVDTLRNSLLSASQLLRSRDRAKSEFLANMSHELRTPLGIVTGMIDLISNNVIPDDELNKSWEIVKRNGDQLLRLIDDILDLSKVEARRLNVEKIDFSIRDLVSLVVEDFSPKADERGIQLRTAFEERSPTIINTDPVRIKQIIYNLVGNAVKFTHKGHVEIRLHALNENVVRITVSDTGIGLNEQQQSVLFSEFTQGDSSHTRKYGGTGLGLSLSRKLARLLGGDVVLIASQPNKGSIFEITFQTYAKEVFSEVETSADPKIETIKKSDPAKTAKILLAEDSPDNVILIKAYLKQMKLDIEVAHNGLEALNLANTKNFDLILMDIQMPDMDGYEATRLLRAAGVQIPIVALTAHALTEHRTKALDAGFSDFLTKPIERERLIKVLHKYLNI